MCGISVIVAKETLNYSELLLLNEKILHRGPDDEGYAVLNCDNEFLIFGGQTTPDNVYASSITYTPKIENANPNLRIKFGLAHRRLSIIDLTESGHLPMSYDNRFWITYNGEIYNYIEIKNELIQLGYKFETESDTEVILVAYLQWGKKCLDKFIGMWAFVIYDSLTENLFISRDRFGIKPLYYHISADGNLYLASEIKQFTNLENWNSKLNEFRALDFLNYGFTDHTDETLIEGVFIFPSACFVEFNVNSVFDFLNFSKYYTIKDDNKINTESNELETFKFLFDQSIHLHLRSDVEIGTALSGGLDSSSIVLAINEILLKQNKEQNQKTFSACSKYEQFSEKQWIDIIADNFKLNSFYCYPDIDNLESDLCALVYSLDEPSQSMSAFLGSSVFKLAKEKNIKVLINGQGADEYLGGYGQFIFLRLTKYLKQFKFISFINDILLIRENRKLPVKNIFIGLISSWINYKKYKVKDNPYVNISELRLSQYKHPYLENVNFGYSKIDIIRSQIYFDALPRYLRWEDRISMVSSIEARVPFLDHRLIDFCSSLPVEYFEQNGISKVIMRKSLSKYLPNKIRERKDKKGFITPEEMWVKNDNPAYFRKLLENSISYSNGFIKNNILEYFDKMVAGKVPFDYTYWRYIQFGYWMKIFKVS